MEELLSNRTQMQQFRVDVSITQIMERLLIHKNHIESLLEEELDISSRLSQVKDTQPANFGLQNDLQNRIDDIERQRRHEQVQRWKDVNMIVPHLLAAIEGLQAAQAREDILRPQVEKPLQPQYVQQYEPLKPVEMMRSHSYA